jgi:hypothetical protein
METVMSWMRLESLVFANYRSRFRKERSEYRLPRTVSTGDGEESVAGIRLKMQLLFQNRAIRQEASRCPPVATRAKSANLPHWPAAAAAIVTHCRYAVLSAGNTQLHPSLHVP